jgi:hypothetical protein|nr:MAG TPA: hypothetical protein [Caudoviricetes sp.]
MTLADKVLQNVKSKAIVCRAKAFESYYYDLKKMVKDPDLLETGVVHYYHRSDLTNQIFNNRGTNSRWYATTTYSTENKTGISLSLMR